MQEITKKINDPTNEPSPKIHYGRDETIVKSKAVNFENVGYETPTSNRWQTVLFYSHLIQA